MVHELTFVSDIVTKPGPWYLSVKDGGYFEILFEDLGSRGAHGQAQKMRVFFHNGTAPDERCEVLMKLTWKSYFYYVFKGVGGDLWPPRGEDVQNASVVDGRLTFRFATIFQPNADNSVTRWEAEYWPEKLRWTIRFFDFL